MNENTPTLYRDMPHGDATKLLRSIAGMIEGAPLHRDGISAARAVLSGLDYAYSEKWAMEQDRKDDTVRLYFSEKEANACEQAQREYPQ